MTVSWTAEAVRDLRYIQLFIAQENPTAATKLAQRIRNASNKLVDFPLLGRTGDFDDTRELVISGSPYVLIYRVSGTALEILRVLHGAQQWPPTEEG